MIINAGITRIVYHDGYPDQLAIDLIQEAGIICECYIGDRS
jgi:dCMP deaminase